MDKGLSVCGSVYGRVEQNRGRIIPNPWIDKNGGLYGEDHIHRIGNVLNPFVPVGVLHYNFINSWSWKGMLRDVDILLIKVR